MAMNPKKRTVLGWFAKTFGGSEEDRTGEIVKEAARADAPQVSKMTNEAKSNSKKAVLGAKPSRPADPKVPVEKMGDVASQLLEAERKRKEAIDAARKKSAAAKSK
jgi:hypothetical protein